MTNQGVSIHAPRRERQKKGEGDTELPRTFVSPKRDSYPLADDSTTLRTPSQPPILKKCKQVPVPAPVVRAQKTPGALLPSSFKRLGRPRASVIQPHHLSNVNPKNQTFSKISTAPPYQGTKNARCIIADSMIGSTDAPGQGYSTTPTPKSQPQFSFQFTLPGGNDKKRRG